MFPFIDAFTVNSQWKKNFIVHTEVNEPDGKPDHFSKLAFTSPPTTNGNQQGVIRLRSIDGCCTAQLLMSISPPPPLFSMFQIRFQEYTYLDQFHVDEQVSVLGARPGIARSESGEVVIVGSFDLSGTKRWKTINFPAMEAIPAVFLTVQTMNGGQPVSVRVRNVTQQSFEAALFEEQALQQSGHVIEKIAYLLIYSPQQTGILDIENRLQPYQLQQIEVDHQWTTVVNVEIKLEEEQSADNELFHVKESVDVLRIGGHVFAQQVSDHGGDTTALRMR
jgi:hypothetical protein